ncbi:MAG: 30S ribosome-binding factor RbfA [Deltaproteobacteria bacterium]|jgi:ribosome-binding factor A|nr:30S ribosome-binding factor RbfA [Deltaproteobacteria bacterium]
MSDRRLEKINRQILARVSELLLFESSDPRLKAVNVTRASITGDMRLARIYYSVLGDEEAKRAAGAALVKAAGFARSRLAETLGLRVTPRLEFFYDPNYEYAQRLGRVLADLSPPTSQEEPRDPPETEDTPETQDSLTSDYSLEDPKTSNPKSEANS